jgi:hypothetical protein
MQPLTREQEATMLRWACTVGHRPGKRAKMFLQADRGLSEEQVENWWNKAIATQKSQRKNFPMMYRVVVVLMKMRSPPSLYGS